MPRTQQQQFTHFLAKASNVLILLPGQLSGDHIGAGWAVAHLCRELGKQATVAFVDPENVAPRYDFLTRPETIVHTLSGSREMILSFATAHNDIASIRTQRSQGRFDIFITPENGMIDPRDFSFTPAQIDYDLAICIGGQDKDAFNAITQHCHDVLFEVPVMNIDIDSENEHYGHVNIVDITASAISAVVADLIDGDDTFPMTRDSAECLLAGIIAATDSFQNTHTAPKAMHTASRLMGHGADQQKIVTHLYKTQPLSLLKLWGATMAQIQWDPEHQLVWACIDQDTFQRTNTTPTDIAAILTKTKSNYAAGKIFVLLYEKDDDTVEGLIDLSRRHITLPLSQTLKAHRTGSGYTFSLAHTTLAEAEQKVLAVLRGESDEKKVIR